MKHNKVLILQAGGAHETTYFTDRWSTTRYLFYRQTPKDKLPVSRGSGCRRRADTTGHAAAVGAHCTARRRVRPAPVPSCPSRHSRIAPATPPGSQPASCPPTAPATRPSHWCLGSQAVDAGGKGKDGSFKGHLAYTWQKVAAEYKFRILYCFINKCTA